MEWVCGLAIIMTMALWAGVGTGIINRHSRWVLVVSVVAFLVGAMALLKGANDCSDQCSGRPSVYVPNRTPSCKCE